MTVVSRGGAVYHDPVTVVELLDFEISAELLHSNGQTREKKVNDLCARTEAVKALIRCD